jgi:hypothetical protein
MLRAHSIRLRFAPAATVVVAVTRRFGSTCTASTTPTSQLTITWHPPHPHLHLHCSTVSPPRGWDSTHGVAVARHIKQALVSASTPTSFPGTHQHKRLWHHILAPTRTNPCGISWHPPGQPLVAYPGTSQWNHHHGLY